MNRLQSCLPSIPWQHKKPRIILVENIEQWNTATYLQYQNWIMGNKNYQAWIIMLGWISSYAKGTYSLYKLEKIFSIQGTVHTWCQSKLELDIKLKNQYFKIWQQSITDVKSLDIFFKHWQHQEKKNNDNKTNLVARYDDLNIVNEFYFNNICNNLDIASEWLDYLGDTDIESCGILHYETDDFMVRHGLNNFFNSSSSSSSSLEWNWARS